MKNIFSSENEKSSLLKNNSLFEVENTDLTNSKINQIKKINNWGIGLMLKENFISNIIKNSPAHNFGLLKNDEILKVNDIDIYKDLDGKTIHLNGEKNSIVYIKIRRKVNNEIKELDYNISRALPLSKKWYYKDLLYS